MSLVLESNLFPRAVPNTSWVVPARVGLAEKTASSPSSFTSGIDDDFNDAVELELVLRELREFLGSLLKGPGDFVGNDKSSNEGIVRRLCTTGVVGLRSEAGSR